jgi:hypothetical protein
MNNIKPVLAAALAAAVLIAAACKTEADNDGNGAGAIISLYLPYTIVPPNTIEQNRRFYNLTTGREAADPGNAGWDIAIEAHDNSFFIRTNSGVSAELFGSNGQGGVWYTEQTNFAAAGMGDRVESIAGEYAPYTQDVTRWALIMAAEPVEEVLNVITYAGYKAGGGETREDPFQPNSVEGALTSFVPYLFNKKQAYTMRGMPPIYTPTNRVYIVRHGDGGGFSKIQLSEVYIEADRYYLELRYAPLF